MRILIVYYSGVGNTKMVANKMFDLLKTQCSVDIISVERFSYANSLEDYDVLVIEYPSIHA